MNIAGQKYIDIITSWGERNAKFQMKVFFMCSFLHVKKLLVNF